MKCPACGNPSISVLYSAPLTYQCNGCKRWLYDRNAGPAIPQLSDDEARRKYPAMFGEPTCSCCAHAPHASTCEFCFPPPPPEPDLAVQGR